MKKAAAEITARFNKFLESFNSLTNQAKERFEKQEWKAQRTANQGRISLHDEVLNLTIQDLKNSRPDPGFGEQLSKNLLATYQKSRSFNHAKAFLSELSPYVEMQLEPEQIEPSYSAEFRGINITNPDKSLIDQLQTIFSNLRLNAFYEDLPDDLNYLETQIHKFSSSPPISLDYYPELFYRNKHAYLLGRIKYQSGFKSFAIPIIHPESGIRVDGLISNEQDIISLFSFSRAYFQVKTTDPAGLIQYLSRLIPSKSIIQLWINLGYQFIGRSLIRRELQKLQAGNCTFSAAPGVRGLVMIVFEVADFPFVFKLPRDRSRPPKDVRRQLVFEKYAFVARHDRAGRMADTQLFDRLVLPINCIEASLLKEICAEASQSAFVENNALILNQVFLERKMIPLNIFLQYFPENEVAPVVRDFGNSIREMIMTNLFPGDLLLKNFGVSENRRVIFYDYDEVTPLTDQRFLWQPPPRYQDAELSAETYYAPEENDVYPEELVHFVAPSGKWHDQFLKDHGELFSPAFWNRWKDFHLKGNIIDLPPYVDGRNLHPHY